MKVAVLSDVHGNAVALEAALKDLKMQGITKAIILGDIVFKGPMPWESLKLLRESNLDILAWIRGNTDMVFEQFTEDYVPSTAGDKNMFEYYNFAKSLLSSENISFLKALPFKCSINIEGVNILCVHGTPQSIVEAVDDTVPEHMVREAMKGVTEDVVLSGHSHTTYIGGIDNIRIFNPGSIGNPLDGDNKLSYGILSFENEKLEMINKRLSYDMKEIIDIAKKRNFPHVDQFEKIILSGGSSN